MNLINYLFLLGKIMVDYKKLYRGIEPLSDFNQEYGVDIKIICRESESEINAHGFILSLASDYFKTAIEFNRKNNPNISKHIFNVENIEAADYLLSEIYGLNIKSTINDCELVLYIINLASEWLIFDSFRSKLESIITEAFLENENGDYSLDKIDMICCYFNGPFVNQELKNTLRHAVNDCNDILTKEICSLKYKHIFESLEYIDETFYIINA